MRGNAVAKFQSGQERCAKAPRCAAVHQRDRRVDGGDRTQSAEQAQASLAEPRRCQGEQRKGEENRCDGGDGAYIATDTECSVQVSEPSVQWWSEADRRFECSASPGE